MSCYFCGRPLKVVSYRCCPHIVFCSPLHCPVQFPYCDLCVHQRIHHTNPYLSAHFLEPSTPWWTDVTPTVPLLVTPPYLKCRRRMTLVPPTMTSPALDTSTADRPERQASKVAADKIQEILHPKERRRCYTCGRLYHGHEYTFCPHIGFCRIECMPNAQPDCLECYLD